MKFKVPQILAMMIDLDDDPEWSIQDEIEDEDEESNPITGESAMDRLACALGGKTMLPHILTNVNTMLANCIEFKELSKVWKKLI